jgi:gamma-glutamylcysteine synthetase
LSRSDGASPRAEAAAPALVSTEVEMPVVSVSDGRPAHPEVFLRLWQLLAADGWEGKEFGVVREVPPAGPCLGSQQMVTTDTGPLLEIAPAPAARLSDLAAQLGAIEEEAFRGLLGLGFEPLGCGVHPTLRPVPDDYFRYRTRRQSYDYAIRERSWRHWTIVDKAAVQEIVDVPFADAPRATRALHRLSGLTNFVLRNDPDLSGEYAGRLSVRPVAWREHVPATGPFAGDASRVGLPAREILSWRDYATLLWEAGPMFLVGTKSEGLVYIPEHPTLIRFLREAPRGGWMARTVAGAPTRLVPEPAHVAQTDWTYLGPARIRWKWKDGGPDLAALLDAWDRDDVEAFLEANLAKVVIENRASSAQPPGCRLVTVALVAGLLANLDETEAFALAEPWEFWAEALEASTREPLDGAVRGRRVVPLLSELLGIARRGLALRGEEDPSGALAPLEQRLEERLSPAEEVVREYRRSGPGGVMNLTRLGGGPAPDRVVPLYLWKR